MKAKSSGHLSVDDEVFRAAFRVGALLVEHAIEVYVEGLLFSCLGSDSIGRSRRYQRTKRAGGLSIGRFPVETVLFSLVADESLGVLFLRRRGVGRDTGPGRRSGHS